MDVALLVPSIHALQTGGNVYNRRILEALPVEVDARVEPWKPEDEPVPELVISGPGSIVIDSLLARSPRSIHVLQEDHPTVTMIVLVHYLHCIDPTSDDGPLARAERQTLEAVDGAITTSQYVCEALLDSAMSPCDVVVAPPGLDDRYRGPLPNRSLRRQPVILTVANLVPEKGLVAFVGVLRQLMDVPWRWVVVGSGALDPEYSRRFYQAVREAGISERVTRTGSVSPPELERLYARADIFALPSRFETRSLSMREAMARGLPVVGYGVGGVPENVGDASTGILVPPGDADALRAALRALLTDPVQRRQMGRMAWRRSRTFRSWTEAAADFLAGVDDLQGRADDA